MHMTKTVRFDWSAVFFADVYDKISYYYHYTAQLYWNGLLP